MATALNLLFALSLAMLAVGCQPQAPPKTTAPKTEAAPPASEPRPAVNGTPQPKLPTIKVFVGPAEVTAEQALRHDQIQTGMMFRTKMAESEGMLFVFGVPMRAAFWMRNTLIPLSCAYIDPDGLILEIRDMKPLDESPLEANSDRVQYVLEVNQGWFQRHKVTVGMPVTTERGSLRQTYLGK